MAADRGDPAPGGPAVGAPAVGGPAVGGPAVGGPAVGGPAVGGPAVGGPAVGGPARGASLADLRSLNASTVFDAIRAWSPISRAQLARVVGLTRPTVSSALETLLEAGLVRPSQPIADRPHYGATYFETAPGAAYLVAFDIDRRQFRAVLVDALGTQLAYVEAHRAMASPADVVQHVEQVCAELCAAAGVQRDDVALAVIGVPAAINPRDQTLTLSAYRLLEGFALGPAVSAVLGIPVFVDNDVNLAAVGEQAAGAARGVADFAYLTIGRNVGAGIVLRDRIMKGAHGAAGEIDAPVNDEDDDQSERSPAAHAFEELARTRIAQHGSELAPTPAAVFAAAARSDPVGLEILAEQAARIADSIAVLCRVLDLDLVVLGGGIGRRCGPLLPAVEGELVRRLAFPPRLLISELQQRPVLVGACTVGIQEAIELVTPQRLAGVIRPGARPVVP